MRHVSEVLAGIFDDFDTVARHDVRSGAGRVRLRIAGVRTGFSDLDALLVGLQPSDLAAIVGVSGIGKTSLAIGIAYGASIPGKESVGYFALQESESQIVARLLAMESGIDLTRIVRGQIEDNEWERLAGAHGRISEASLFIDDSSFSIGQIRANIRQMQAEGKLDLVIIDDLRMIEGSQSLGRKLDRSDIVREIKAIAKDCRIPIVLVAQTEEGRPRCMSASPWIASLEELGNIEEVADVVALLHREDQFDPLSEKRELAEVRILKHRHGRQGIAVLRFFDRTARFTDLELYPGPGV